MRTYENFIQLDERVNSPVGKARLAKQTAQNAGNAATNRVNKAVSANARPAMSASPEVMAARKARKAREANATQPAAANADVLAARRKRTAATAAAAKSAATKATADKFGPGKKAPSVPGKNTGNWGKPVKDFKDTNTTRATQKPTSGPTSRPSTRSDKDVTSNGSGKGDAYDRQIEREKAKEDYEKGIHHKKGDRKKPGIRSGLGKGLTGDWSRQGKFDMAKKVGTTARNAPGNFVKNALKNPSKDVDSVEGKEGKSAGRMQKQY